MHTFFSPLIRCFNTRRRIRFFNTLFIDGDDVMLLFRQMPNAVLVFHQAPLDFRFLQRATLANFRCPMLFTYIDTLEIEKTVVGGARRTAA